MANVTYMLGAGASAQAIPTVAHMNLRMENFLHWLKTNKNIKSSHLEVFNAHLAKAKKHLSIDTYAKKLFLADKINDLYELRRFLNLFFLFESAGIASANNLILKKAKDSIDAIEKIGLQNTAKCVELPVDPRYDAFLASLLIGKKNNLKLPDNVRIISWNYDLQLEMAFKEFDNSSTIDNIQSRLCMFPQPGEFPPTEKKFNVVSLNGKAGCHLSRTNSKFEELVNILYEDDTFKDFSERYLENFGKIPTDNDSVNTPLISFAWEGEPPFIFDRISAIAIEAAKKIIANTEIMIIVGYSFPTFNRQIDSNLLKSLNLGMAGKIYYQVPTKKEFRNYRSRLQGVAPHLHERQIEFIDDVSQFYIPFQLDQDLTYKMLIV